MNTRDAEVVAGLLVKAGYQLAATPQEAGIILFNTCSVRQHAEDKVWSEIGRYPKGKTIGVIGCMAQNYKEDIFRRCPNVSLVVGPADIARIPALLGKLGAGAPGSGRGVFERKLWETEGESRPEEIYHTRYHSDGSHAYVVISEGCSNFCSYCVVPHVRGSLHHRDDQAIIREIEEGIAAGVGRFTLLGQNVNAYRCRGVDFNRLLAMVDAVPDLEQFSFITSHPRDVTPGFFETMASCVRLKRYLHLPVQSGSDRILGLMNRGYTRKFYFDLADKYRTIVPGGALTTDIIVGFPTETEEDFRQTLELVQAAEFDAAFIFKYSPRPNTVASRMQDDVARPEKERRHGLLLDLQKKISRKKCSHV